MAFFLDDEPTIDDRLKWTSGRSVRELGDLIATCKPPAILGVHGDWGAGKTSFLYLLHHYLTGTCPHHPNAPRGESTWGVGWAAKPNVAVVWFEAWRYQYEAVPVVALLHEIRAQLPLVSSLFEQARKLGEVAVKSALFSMESVTKRIGLQASKVQEAGEKWEKDRFAEQLPSSTLRQFLENALQQVLPAPAPGTEPPRLVVLIDDLDRCDSATAYKLLEGIKIYLNLPNCVFVLGVNQSVIEERIASQLKAGDDARQLAREYLEKICRNFWPLPAYPDTDDLMVDWLTRVRNGDSTRPVGEHMDGAYIGVVAKVIKDHHCLPANPRKIKAFANTLALFLSRPGWNTKPGDSVKDTLNPVLCVFLAYLAHFFPDIYRVLAHDPAFFNLILEWCETPQVPTADGKESSPKHDTFRGVKLLHNPTAPSAAAAVPTSPGSTTAFRDPARGNVFRAHLLVLKLRDLGLTTHDIASCILK